MSEPIKRSVRELRRAQRMSLNELAQRSGIPEHILRLIEAKHYLPSPQQATALAQALGVPVEALDIGTREAKPGTWGTGGTYSQPS